MKKWFFAASLLLLAGCSDDYNTPVSSVYPQQQEEKTPEMTSDVNVYSVGQSAKGTIIKVNDRSKWVVTVASVVAQHPKALIVTSEGQQLEGQVVKYDKALNIALVHIRNSAEVKAEKLTSFASVNESGESTVVNANDLVAFMKDIPKEPLKREQRMQMAQDFAGFVALEASKEPVIENYKKQTFLYNPDILFAFVEQFHSQFESFMQTGDMAPLQPMLASDLFAQTLETMQQTLKNSVKFKKLDLATVQLTDNMYIVTGTCEFIEKGKEKSATITYKVIEKNKQYSILSMIIE